MKYIVKPFFLAGLREAIVNYLTRFQVAIKQLKTEGIEVIGYARKSVGDESGEKRLQLVQAMVNNLISRSLADKVYVSISSHASAPLASRDLAEQPIFKDLQHVEGSTQDLLEYIKSAEKDICLVSLDFAGLSTSPVEIQKLTV
ncbi:uncharacterized protein BYT42DRAFT_491594 [Radiomyces spectabilis]|uniref:uncharacterized protein n=1 Tax=Radiomyces spectabilis TaxID=64574 RepID=UPI00221ECF65|nr:uncharacterized protein BYT42DRAFT_491594 [Radiomyces spectabilis]KAI8388294.1 hypothetical protein BYT42DRAFT_491594 [Radiomyces spectabilis]